MFISKVANLKYCFAKRIHGRFNDVFNVDKLHNILHNMNLII